LRAIGLLAVMGWAIVQPYATVADSPGKHDFDGGTSERHSKKVAIYARDGMIALRKIIEGKIVFIDIHLRDVHLKPHLARTFNELGHTIAD
jgi:hypothetical protein